MLLAAARKICQVGTRHQIAIEPAAAGYSPFRDFVHCSFADAGRRWVWLRSPTAGIRKPWTRYTSGPLYPQKQAKSTGLLNCLPHCCGDWAMSGPGGLSDSDGP